MAESGERDHVLRNNVTGIECCRTANNVLNSIQIIHTCKLLNPSLKVFPVHDSSTAIGQRVPGCGNSILNLLALLCAIVFINLLENLLDCVLILKADYWRRNSRLQLNLKV